MNVTPEVETEFLSLPDVAKLIGRSTRTIYRWVKKGTFPQPFDFGGHPRWHRDQITSAREANTPTVV